MIKNDEFKSPLEMLRNNLFKDKKNISFKTILVTSSKFKEGKTTIATSLAEMLADNTYKTLIIDGNSENPTLHTIYRLMNEDGFFSLTHGMERECDAVQNTENEFLDILTAGRCNSTSFDKTRFDKCIDQLKNLYDVIIIDSSSLSVGSNTLALASYADAVILVVESLRIRWQTVQRSIEQMKNVNANLLGVVINKQKYFIPSYLYKYL